jgi:hypothetical protein
MTMVNPAISGYDEKHDASNGVDVGIDNFYSSLQRSRLDYVPPKPSILQGVIKNCFFPQLVWQGSQVAIVGSLETERSNMTS